MSYARFSDESDVYVFADVGGGFTCSGCILDGGGWFNRPTEIEMVEHLREHVSAGHGVPDHAIYRLLNEHRCRGEHEEV